MTKRARAKAKPPPATMPTDDERGVYVRVPVSPEIARAFGELASAFDSLVGIARTASDAVSALEREGKRLRARRRR